MLDPNSPSSAAATFCQITRFSRLDRRPARNVEPECGLDAGAQGSAAVRYFATTNNKMSTREALKTQHSPSHAAYVTAAERSEIAAKTVNNIRVFFMIAPFLFLSMISRYLKSAGHAGVFSGRRRRNSWEDVNICHVVGRWWSRRTATGPDHASATGCRQARHLYTRIYNYIPNDDDYYSACIIVGCGCKFPYLRVSAANYRLQFLFRACFPGQAGTDH